VKTANVSYRAWHDRLGHLNFEDLKKVEILMELSLTRYRGKLLHAMSVPESK